MLDTEILFLYVSLYEARSVAACRCGARFLRSCVASIVRPGSISATRHSPSLPQLHPRSLTQMEGRELFDLPPAPIVSRTQAVARVRIDADDLSLYLVPAPPMVELEPTAQAKQDAKALRSPQSHMNAVETGHGMLQSICAAESYREWYAGPVFNLTPLITISNLIQAVRAAPHLQNTTHLLC